VVIKYIKIVRSKGFQNVPKLGIWFKKISHLATLVLRRMRICRAQKAGDVIDKTVVFIFCVFVD
jgi:hypothetical protein